MNLLNTFYRIWRKIKSVKKLHFIYLHMYNFYGTNLKIFNFEEKYYNTNRKYKTLALIILSLIDL